MMDAKTLIGYLYASIAGDRRYTDRIEVFHDEATGDIVVEVSSTTASGGMDGAGGATAYEIKGCGTCYYKAADVLRMVKHFVADDRFNFKKYGKATKNFVWRCPGGERNGLSLDLIKTCLYAEELHSQ